MDEATRSAAQCDTSSGERVGGERGGAVLGAKLTNEQRYLFN
jgi:hypothetical protein